MNVNINEYTEERAKAITLEIHRGDVYFVKSHETVGHQIQIKNGRPAIIVSDDKANTNSSTVMVVYLTTKGNNPGKTQFKLDTLINGRKNSIVKCEQVTTIDKCLLGDFICRISDEEVKSLNCCLEESLSLDSSHTVPHAVPVNNSANENIEVIKSERDIYKGLYESLLAKLISK